MPQSGQAPAWQRGSRRMSAAAAGTQAARGCPALETRTSTTSTASSPMERPGL
jgi:hypothetical protein